MNFISRTITGIVISVIGFSLVVYSFFSDFFLAIYGIVIFIIGVFILFNKKEDEIEEIKYNKIKKLKGGKNSGGVNYHNRK